MKLKGKLMSKKNMYNAHKSCLGVIFHLETLAACIQWKCIDVRNTIDCEKKILEVMCVCKCIHILQHVLFIYNINIYILYIQIYKEDVPWIL